MLEKYGIDRPEETVLWRTKECLDHFLMLTRVSKTNGKDTFVVLF